ncbi:NUDIX hydrolase [Gordonia neofelifaecis]|uniref:NUDIX hydrolase n=1 Tax=Gordonia neofelifaecis NRRL B-59395 TaxID=644548 RepID=F1YDR0_9ACTN|nr:NUDIX domain-containing protein [Gordonia neofelifaecis]EGD57000.1 NUDIX hydrolase [Gordonia neofelifaecis NRRL B-59395]
MGDRRIVVSAVVMRDDAGRVLTVRKNGSGLFMFPGGKLDDGESHAAAAVREAREEISVELDERSLRRVGTFAADAANEPGHVVVAEVFEHPLVGDPVASAEIAEIAWVDPADRSRDDLAPLLRDEVFPLL